jgi:hypothetical protein
MGCNLSTLPMSPIAEAISVQDPFMVHDDIPTLSLSLILRVTFDPLRKVVFLSSPLYLSNNGN